MPASRAGWGAGNAERWVVWVVGVLVVLTAAVTGYYGTAYTAPPDALADARSTPGVTVEPLDAPGDGYEIYPETDAVPERALVFYPGGRVHPDAYLPLLAPLAAQTETAIFVTQPPLNLAVFDQNAAGDVIDAHPRIDEWYVGGHSLGGAMACRFVRQHPTRVSGLVLLASYCDQDVGDTDVRVLAVRGSADTVLNVDAYERNLDNLPADRTTVVIDGMNHSQVGAYRDQPGDTPGTISYDEAHERLREELTEFFEAE